MYLLYHQHPPHEQDVTQDQFVSWRASHSTDAKYKLLLTHIRLEVVQVSHISQHRQLQQHQKQDEQSLQRWVKENLKMSIKMEDVEP